MKQALKCDFTWADFKTNSDGMVPVVVQDAGKRKKQKRKRKKPLNYGITGIYRIIRDIWKSW